MNCKAFNVFLKFILIGTVTFNIITKEIEIEGVPFLWVGAFQMQCTNLGTMLGNKMRPASLIIIFTSPPSYYHLYVRRVVVTGYATCETSIISGGAYSIRMLYVNNSVFFLYSLRSPYGNITSGTQTETECHQGGGRCVF